MRGSATLVHPAAAPAGLPVPTAQPRPRGSHAALPAIAAAGAPQPGTPAYLQEAYDLSYLSATAGATQTVAIVDAFDDPNAESDLATYRAEFGLPACTSAGGCFNKVNENGGTTNYPTSRLRLELEISLDLDAVSALCPNCHIDLVEANSAGTSDLATAELEADKLGVNVISDSWDVPLSGRQARQFMQTGDYTFNGDHDRRRLGRPRLSRSVHERLPGGAPGRNRSRRHDARAGQRERRGKRARVHRIRVVRRRLRL